MSNYPRLDKTGLTRAINGIASKVLGLIPGVFSRSENGLVPTAPSGSGTSKYLREDGTWNTPDSGIFYGICTTLAATAAKIVTLSDASGWKLKQGASVAVKFSNTNTFSATAQAPVTLNVNNTGAKNIYYGGSANPTGTNTTAFGRANYVNTYVYDGTYWVWTGSSADNNTTYSAMSKSELTTGTATTSRVVRADYLKQGIEEIIEDKDTNFEGTRSEWEALSTAEKANYLTMDFTDDGGLGDISDEDVTFTSSDVVDANANSWTVVSPIASGTTLNTLFSRVSQMFKNIRYLYKMLGTINNVLSETVLWQGDTNYATQYTINLSDSYQNYKKLLFFLIVDMYNGRPIIREVSCEQIDYLRTVNAGSISMCWGYSSTNDYFDIQPTSTTTSLVIACNITKCVKVIGLKHY